MAARNRPPLRVEDGRKRYGPVQALAEVDLEVRRGETFAFLGPNGAGTETPEGIARVGGVLPVRRLDDAVFAADEPGQTGLAIAWGDLAVVLAWGIAVAAWRFSRWSPTRG